MRYLARVLIRPKAEIRDPQGETILGALRALGHEIQGVRTGKEILVTFDAADERAAHDEARRMGDELLANPVIEDYEVEVLETSRDRPDPRTETPSTMMKTRARA